MVDPRKLSLDLGSSNMLAGPDTRPTGNNDWVPNQRNLLMQKVMICDIYLMKVCKEVVRRDHTCEAGRWVARVTERGLTECPAGNTADLPDGDNPGRAPANLQSLSHITASC